MRHEALMVLPSVVILILTAAMSGIGLAILRRPAHRLIVGSAMVFEIVMALALIAMVIVPY